MARNELFARRIETNQFVSGATPDPSEPDRGLKQSAYYCRFAWKLSNSEADFGVRRPVAALRSRDSKCRTFTSLSVRQNNRITKRSERANFEVQRPVAALRSRDSKRRTLTSLNGPAKQPNNKAVTGHRTPKRSVPQSERL